MTDKTKLEKALQESGIKFCSVVQSATDAIIIADSDENIIMWNRGAQTIFSYTEEVLGKNRLRFWCLSDTRCSSKDFLRLIDSGERHLEIRFTIQ